MAGSLHLAGIAKVTGIIIHPLSTGLFLSSGGAPCYVAPIKAILLLNPRYCNFLWPKSGGKGEAGRRSFLAGAIRHRRGSHTIARHPVVEQSGNALPPGEGARFPAFTFKTHFSLLRFPDGFEIEFHRSPIRTTGPSTPPSLPRYCKMRPRFIKIAFAALPTTLLPFTFRLPTRIPINGRERNGNRNRSRSRWTEKDEDRALSSNVAKAFQVRTRSGGA